MDWNASKRVRPKPQAWKPMKKCWNVSDAENRSGFAPHFSQIRWCNPGTFTFGITGFPGGKHRSI
jgi:hypothetical protein